MAGVKTGKIAGNVDYAKVADRLKQFREDNPRSKVETTYTRNEDGSVDFRAYILRDKADEFSADATGTATYSSDDMKKIKAFEKLETIAVGRALSLLGYLNNGEVASTEEMEEFNQYKEARLAEDRQNAIDNMQSANDVNELRIIFSGLGELMADPEIIKVKNEMKAKLPESKTDEED